MSIRFTKMPPPWGFLKLSKSSYQNVAPLELAFVCCLNVYSIYQNAAPMGLFKIIQVFLPKSRSPRACIRVLSPLLKYRPDGALVSHPYHILPKYRSPWSLHSCAVLMSILFYQNGARWGFLKLLVFLCFLTRKSLHSSLLHLIHTSIFVSYFS